MNMERFDEYMERCLYGPEGFYAVDGRAGGRRGDFITSPEVGPLFGAVLAQAIDSWWDDLNQPDPFTIYDVGCGPGALLRAIAKARPDRPWNLIGVDRVNSADASLAALPDDLTGSVVLANELLDNLPFRIVEQTEAGLREVFVADGIEKLRKADEEAAFGLGTEILANLKVGQRAPLQSMASQWVEQTLARGVARLFVVDYGQPTTQALADRGGWLRTYRAHERGDDPLCEPGGWDITSDVAFDQLPTPDRFETQKEFLQRWGIDELVEQGRSHWKKNAHAPDLEAFRMRSRISEAEALLDPQGLGQWMTALWVR